MPATKVNKKKSIQHRHMVYEAKKDQGVNGMLYIRGLPVNLKNFFKAACDKRGITMTQKITEMMREFVEKEAV